MPEEKNTYSTPANWEKIKDNVVEQYLKTKESMKKINAEITDGFKPSNFGSFFNDVIALYLDLSSKISSLSKEKQTYYSDLKKLDDYFKDPALLIPDSSINEKYKEFTKAFRLLRDLLEDLGYLKVETSLEELTPEIIEANVWNDRNRPQG